MKFNATDEARYYAQRYFELLWKGRTSLMTKSQAYIWFAWVMSIPQNRAYIGCLSEAQCYKLIENIKVILNKEKWVTTRESA